MTQQSTIKFTVLMAVYKNDNVTLFKRALKSVFDNTIQPDSFVLVVDGPVKHELKVVIYEFKHKYNIDVVWLPENTGLANALNVGLSQVKTEWVARADADDINLSHRFFEQTKIIKNYGNQLDLLGSAVAEMDFDGNLTQVKSVPQRHVDICDYLRKRNPFNHMTVFYRADFVRSCGGYPSIYLREDYALWATMLTKGAISYNDKNILVHASAGRELLNRRGGLKYALGEIKLQRHLLKLDVKHTFEAFFDGIVRAIIFTFPRSFRGIIYKKFLRSNF